MPPQIRCSKVRAILVTPPGPSSIESLVSETAKLLGQQVGSITQVCHPTSIGAAAYNKGALEIGSHEYFLFCQLGVTPGLHAVSLMQRVLDENPTMGVVGPVSDGPIGIQQVAQPGQHYRTPMGFTLFSDYIASLHKAAFRPAPRVDSFFFLVRRSTFEALRGFDPRFSPAFFEDDDFCARMAQELGLLPAIAYGAWVSWPKQPPWPPQWGPPEAAYHTSKERYEKKWERYSRLTIAGTMPPEIDSGRLKGLH